MRALRPLILLSIVALAASIARPAHAATGEGPFRLELRLDAPEAGPELALLDGGLAGGGDIATNVAPIVALILGIIPGFGLGHLVAGDGDGFVRWLVIDLIVTAVAVITPLAFDLGGVVDALFYAGALVLRVVEGLSAMNAAERNWVWVEPGPEAPAFANAARTLRPMPVRPVLTF